eukprot:3242366-Pyramimonas_sp.AAC.1
MQEAWVYSHSGPIRCRNRGYILRGVKNRGRQKKGAPVGVVYRAHSPALGSWEDQPPAAYEVVLGCCLQP